MTDCVCGIKTLIGCLCAVRMCVCVYWFVYVCVVCASSYDCFCAGVCKFFLSCGEKRLYILVNI